MSLPAEITPEMGAILLVNEAQRVLNKNSCLPFEPFKGLEMDYKQVEYFSLAHS